MGVRELHPQYTYSDYVQWEGDWELIEGEAWAMAPAPSIEHQSISLTIASMLKQALEMCPACKALMEVDYKIDEFTTLRPDVLVACHIPRKAPYVDHTPEMIFEVVSPSTKQKDRTVKYRIYRDNGVKYYILVDPKATLAEIYELDERSGEYRLTHEAVDETISFEFGKCRIDFAFSRIWED